MSMHPVLTTTVYIVIAIVFISVVAYMILYTRGMKAKQAALNVKGREEVSVEEGIAIATEGKEKAGRTGSIN